MEAVHAAVLTLLYAAGLAFLFSPGCCTGWGLGQKLWGSESGLPVSVLPMVPRTLWSVGGERAGISEEPADVGGTLLTVERRAGDWRAVWSMAATQGHLRWVSEL